MSNRSRRTLSVWLTFFRASQKLTYLLTYKVRMHPCDKIHNTIWSEKFHQVGTKTLLILLSHQRRLRTVVDGKKWSSSTFKFKPTTHTADTTEQFRRVGLGRVGSGRVVWTELWVVCLFPAVQVPVWFKILWIILPKQRSYVSQRLGRWSAAITTTESRFPTSVYGQ